MTSTRSSSSAYDEKVSKKSGVIEKTIHKFSATTSLMGNSRASSPAPPRAVTQSVIKGSFEITKTEADISQKKDTPPAQFQTTPGGHKATTMKAKNPSSGGKFGNLPVSSGASASAARPNLGKIDKIEKVNSTTTTSTTMMPSTTTSSSSTSTSTTSTSSSPPAETEELSKLDNVHKYPQANEKDLPQLDVNLFTSAPILDSQPWHPINPATREGNVEVESVAPSSGDQRKPEQRKGHPATTTTTASGTNIVGHHNKPLQPIPVQQQPHQRPGVATGQAQQPTSSGKDGDVELAKRNKLMETVTKAPSRPIYYQSFTNPTFSLTTMGIERLGAADVRPYPLPVNKLYDDGQGQAGSPLDTGMHLNEKEIMNGGGNAQEELLEPGYDQRFEHLGGGVSAKKPEVMSVASGQKEKEVEKGAPVTTTVAPLTPSLLVPSAEENSEQLGDILLDLLDLQQPQQRHKYIPEGEEEVTAITELEEDQAGQDGEQSFESTTKLNFINIREHILQKNKVAMETVITTTTFPTPAEQTLVSSSATSTGSKLNNPEPQTVTLMSSNVEEQANTQGQHSDSDKDANWSGPSLFPMHTTWELINGTVTDQKPDPSHLRRVYNDTLQAWIVENREEDSAVAITGQDNNQQASYGNQEPSSSSSSSSKKQDGTIQNISVIFDTLASKLGITPDVSSKSPPFQNKVRHRTQPPSLSAASPSTVSKTRVVTTPRVTATQPPPPTTTQRTTEPEIITIARSEEQEYEYEDEEEEEDEEAIPTTTTTTTKKPRRKTTTKRKSVVTTTSKPRTRSTKPANPQQPSDAGGEAATETRSSIRVAGTASKLPPAPVTTITPKHRQSTSTTTSKPVQSIVSNSEPMTTDLPVQTTTTERASVTESVIPPIFQLDPNGDDNVVPIILSQPEASGEAVAELDGTYEMSSEAISFGKAEVEVVVDPDTVYADILRKQITTRAPPLVTLLPVRSNSGIRTFRTPMQQQIETRRSFPKIPAVPPPATIVRTNMRFGT